MADEEENGPSLPLLTSGKHSDGQHTHQRTSSGDNSTAGAAAQGDQQRSYLSQYGSIISESRPVRREPDPRVRRSDSVLMDPEPVTLSWSNIKVFVPEKKKKKQQQQEQQNASTRTSRGSVKVDAEQGTFYNVDHHAVQTSVGGSSNGQKEILKGVTGAAKPGSLVAIMGASGAGKSTLMNVLTNRNLKDYRIEGDVRVNGVCIGNGIRNISAYVQQDDLFFGTLTVRETLQFRAMLRMDQSLDVKTRLQRVEEVIVEMGLSKCADTQVGIAGRKKGISGGEAKRLSFACEMLTNPPLMFCDEPTSGLDSYMSQNIVQMMQTMASKNRTILCTIHQPSSEIFAMFDQLLLMAEGRVAFMGPLAQAVEFFGSLNYVCPNNYNPADFYILTCAVVPGNEAECREKVKAISDAFAGTVEANEITQSIQKATAESSVDAALMKDAFSNESRYEAGWFRQFRSVFWRSWVSLLRDVVLFRVRVMQTLFVSVLLGLIYLQLDYDQKGVMDLNGAIFLIITQSSFSSMFSVVNSFPHEIGIFLREYGTGLYRTDVYFLAKSIAEFPTFVFLPAILLAIDYWMIGLNDAVEAFFIAMGIIILVANVAVSFGLIISTLTADVNIALAVAPPILIPFMMFGGFFLNSASVPVYFVWMKYLSWFLYANEYMMVNQWNDIDSIECDRPNGTCQYNTGADVLSYLSFSADNNWMNLGLLFTLFFGFRIISFFILLIRAKLSKS